jgi:C1A family cysteine protease
LQKDFNITITDPEALKIATANIIRENNLVRTNNERFRVGKSSFEQSLYKFSHLSDAEFNANYAGSITESLRSQSRAFHFTDANECDNLPAYKNWAEEGKLGPVKDQLSCGDCYIFSATTVLEGMVSIEYGTTPSRLSEQQMLECMKNVSTQYTGCKGGK